MAVPQKHIEDVLCRIEKHMLAKALPYMFSKEPHEFQIAMKAMAKKALERQHAAEVEKQEAAKKNVEEKQGLLNTQRDDVKRSEDLLAQRLRESGEKEAEYTEAANRIKEEEAIQSLAQSRHDQFAQEREILQNSKEEIDRALQGFSQLLEGKCGNDRNRENAVNACLLHLLGASKVLQAAVPKALTCEPSMRGPFCERVFQEVSQLLNEKSATKAASLRVDAEKHRRASAEALGAWAVMEQARDELRQAELAKVEADGAHHAAKVVCSNTQEAVVDAEKTLNYALSMQAIVDNLVEDVDKALSSFAMLENGDNTLESVCKEPIEKQLVEEAVDKENEHVAKRQKLDHVEADNHTVVEPLTVVNQ